MNTNAAATTLPTITRKSLNGFVITIEGGCLCHQGGTFTRHAPLTSKDDVFELAEAVSLFDRAEMPSLAAAASKLAKRGPLSLWPLVDMAARLSHRAGTRPADVRPPQKAVDVSVWAPEELRAREAGCVVAPKGTRRVLVDE